MKQLTNLKKIIALLAILFCVITQLSAQSPTFEWATEAGASGNDFCNSIAVDAAGNVFATGGFYGTVDFDPGPGVFNLTSAGATDIFISKSDSAGNLIWAKQLGGTGNDLGNLIKIDGKENIYTTGRFQSIADFDPGAGVNNLSSSGSDDIYISKLDSAGNLIWAKPMGGTSTDIGFSIAFDPAGNIYSTGLFMGTADFDPGNGVFNLIAAGSYDIFISKLDSAGNFLWAKSFGQSSNDRGTSITTDAWGNIYSTGYFEGTIDFDPGPATYNLTAAAADVYVLKLDPSGNFIWAKQFGSTQVDGGKAIAADNQGNIYTAGVFQGTVDFDPGTGTFNLTDNGGAYDGFISKLDTGGNFIWAKQLGTTYFAGVNALALDNPGNIYATGIFSNTCNFDTIVSNISLTSFGVEDVFISKLDSAGNFEWAEQVGGPSIDYGLSVGVDGLGNVYAAGEFQTTADFDPGSGVYNLTSSAVNDLFIMKMSQGVFTGIPETILQNNVNIFPNPSNEKVNITIDQPLNHGTLLLINTTGQVVMKKENISGNQFAIDLSDLATGIYFIEVRSDDKIISSKKIIRL
jgi:hypothetical protein